MRPVVWVGFGVLCILSGSFWAIPDEGGLALLERQGLVYGVVGLVAMLLAGRRVSVWTSFGVSSGVSSGDWSWSRLLWVAVAMVGVFGVPIAVVVWTRDWVAETNRSALFAMVPVVVVLSVAAGADARGARRFLVPALVGLGGLLLLLPLSSIGTVRGWSMLALVVGAVIVAGVSSVALYRLLRGVRFVEALAVAGVANCGFLLVCCVLRGEFVWRGGALASAVGFASLADGFEIGLIVWLLRGMPPVRFASRYLLIPLVTVLESFVVVRPEPTARLGFGTALLAVGAGMMLWLKDVEEEAMLSLR
jgi:hypothetical protein